MTSTEELQNLLADPTLKQFFGEEQPTFAELVQALSEFGEPLFELQGNRSFCSVIVITAAGKEMFRGVAETPANPSAAGLACLIKLLKHFPNHKRVIGDEIEPNYLDTFITAFTGHETE